MEQKRLYTEKTLSFIYMYMSLRVVTQFVICNFISINLLVYYEKQLPLCWKRQFNKKL